MAHPLGPVNQAAFVSDEQVAFLKCVSTVFTPAVPLFVLLAIPEGSPDIKQTCGADAYMYIIMSSPRPLQAKLQAQRSQLKQSLVAEAMKECTFRPKTNEGQNRELIAKILQAEEESNRNSRPLTDPC